MSGPLRIGTRRSALATAQTATVVDLLRDRTGRDITLIPIVTTGDVSTAPLDSFGGVGVFTSALREALHANRIDVAVHSFKDLPTAPEAGLVVAAVPLRMDPRDALVSRDGLTLGELPASARIGTGSVRRRAQLLALGLGLQLVPLRGNVDTRLGLVDSGELDAVVVAYAGLQRLGRAERATEVIDPLLMLPAPAQGALAVECRSDDQEVLDLVAGVDDHYSHISVHAERALLAALEAGCSSPVGALAEVVEAEEGLEISLRATVVATDGSDSLRLSATGPLSDAAGVGHRLADVLLSDGAADIMGARDDARA